MIQLQREALDSQKQAKKGLDPPPRTELEMTHQELGQLQNQYYERKQEKVYSLGE